MKYCFLIVVFLLFFDNFFAQNTRKIQWGFHAGLTHSLWQFPEANFQKSNALYAVFKDTLVAVKGNNKLGIQMGLNMSYAFNERWKIRIMPCVDLAQADFKLNFVNRFEYRHYECANLCLPIQAVWRTCQKEKSLYLFAGINPKANFQTNRSLYEITLKRTDISLDFGIGYGRIGKALPFNPELRFALGLNNLIKDDTSLSYVPIGTFKYHSIALICHFY